MRRAPALALALIASAALAEVVLNNQGTRAGPVTTLNCSGSGITCTRNGSTGTLSVSGADGGSSALVQGCPAGQYFNALDAGIGYCSAPAVSSPSILMSTQPFAAGMARPANSTATTLTDYGLAVANTVGTAYAQNDNGGLGVAWAPAASGSCGGTEYGSAFGLRDHFVLAGKVNVFPAVTDGGWAGITSAWLGMSSGNACASTIGASVRLVGVRYLPGVSDAGWECCTNDNTGSATCANGLVGTPPTSYYLGSGRGHVFALDARADAGVDIYMDGLKTCVALPYPSVSVYYGPMATIQQTGSTQTYIAAYWFASEKQ